MSSYKLKATAAFLSLTGQWIFWGGAPDSFILHEEIDLVNKTENFSILLIDDEGVNWVKLYSDTTKHSIVKLPTQSVKIMGTDGIKFIGSLFRLFVDTALHYVSGKVTLGDSLFVAEATESGCLTNNTRRFTVSTKDKNSTYIEGEVLIEYKDDVLIYREIDVSLKRSKLQMKLTLLNTQIK
jgi:hypothetical protein